MPDSPENELKHQEFWSRMAKNSLVVQRMPAWMKGSPINKRSQITLKVSDKRINVKTTPIANR
jgi:hypothetical protein